MSGEPRLPWPTKRGTVHPARHKVIADTGASVTVVLSIVLARAFHLDSAPRRVTTYPFRDESAPQQPESAFEVARPYAFGPSGTDRALLPDDRYADQTRWRPSAPTRLAFEHCPRRSLAGHVLV